MTDIAGYIVWIVGIPALVRKLTRRRVAILLYHDPDPAVFEAHLRYLSRRYRFVPFDRLFAALEGGGWSELPDHGVVVHLDDGYRRNAELVRICERFGVRPTLYLCSHVVGTRRRFWSKLAGGRSKRMRLVENTRLLEKLRDEAGYTPEREYDERQALCAEELAEMERHFDFQSHGRYHFSLLTLDDAALAEDLAASRSRIESLTGQPCEHFSYPYGDYSEREIAAARQAGYKSGRTTRPGWVGPGTRPYELPIVADVPGTISPNGLRLHLTGLPRLFKRAAYRVLTRHIHAVIERISMSRRFF